MFHDSMMEPAVVDSTGKSVAAVVIVVTIAFAEAAGSVSAAIIAAEAKTNFTAIVARLKCL